METTTELPRDFNSGDRVAVTAYRFGDKFSFSGCATSATGCGFVATVMGSLRVGELVLLRYSTKAQETPERYGRVRYRRGDEYEFELVSLNDRQRRCLTETGDSLLVTNLMMSSPIFALQKMVRPGAAVWRS